jgi:hypothetical protein
LNRRRRPRTLRSSKRITRSAVILRSTTTAKRRTTIPFTAPKSRLQGGPQRDLRLWRAQQLRNGFRSDQQDIVGHREWADQWDEINRVRAGVLTAAGRHHGPQSRATGSVSSSLSWGKKRYTRSASSVGKRSSPPPIWNSKFGAMNEFAPQRHVCRQIGIFGNLYDIDLIPNRKSLALSGGLLDKVVDNQAERNSMRKLGTGFGIDHRSGFAARWALCAEPRWRSVSHRHAGIAGPPPRNRRVEHQRRARAGEFRFVALALVI